MTDLDDEDAIELQDSLLRTAMSAVAAGTAEVLLRSAAPNAVATKSSATDPVTDADRASEIAIIQLILQDRPLDGIIGEEGGLRPGSSGYRWVIDPLDGTVNFLYGIAAYAISVACERLCGDKWIPWVAVVHDITRDETFSAATGKGAVMNGVSLTVGSNEHLASALVATGFSYDRSTRGRQGTVLASLLPQIRDIRSGGSAALELCWVACGRSDAYYEDDLAVWDVAAGKLIVAEAGGHTTPLGTGILASNKKLYPQLAAQLLSEVLH